MVILRFSPPICSPVGEFEHGRDHLVGEIAAERLADEAVAQLDLLGEALELGLDPLAVRHVRPGADDLLRLAVVVVRDGERVLDPDVVAVAMAETIFEAAAALADQPLQFGEHAVGVLRMETLDPELLVVAHLPRRIGHDRVQILADEGAGIVARDLGGVDDGGAGADQGLEVVHQRHAFAERLLGLLAGGNIGPRADDLERAALAVVDHAERVLDPDIMSVAVPEAVLERPAAFLDQRRHLLEHARGILRMQTHGPEILVLQHLP